MPEMQIVISGGEIRFVHDDDLAKAFNAAGQVTIARASHVEPDGQEWKADLSPVGGPVLGPFKERSKALSEEVAWLQAHHTPKPA